MLICCPLIAFCQEVQPILSPYYLRLITKDSLLPGLRRVDSTNDMQKASLFHSYYSLANTRAKDIRIVNRRVFVHPISDTYVGITGGMSANVELQYLNRQAATQSRYAQGRSINGSLAWQGPETNELFSFGPALSTLEFDGIPYVYDVNGKLVPTGSDNGVPAHPYDNSITRPASLISTSYNLEAKLRNGNSSGLAFGIKGSVSREKTAIQFNRNAANHQVISMEWKIIDMLINASYTSRYEHFDHGNRNGFINRLYQNSLLTPASFSTKQGAHITNGQRSYSQYADNPFFLLDNEQHFSKQQQKSGAVSISSSPQKFRFTLVQHAGYKKLHTNESYQPGTAFFPNGQNVTRTARADNYSLTANLRYRADMPGDFNTEISGNYIFSTIRSTISYGNDFPGYRYQRSAHDVAIMFATKYYGDYFEAGTSLSNKFYLSNTVSKDAYFLPAISGYAFLRDLFGVLSLNGKLHTSFNRFNSELPIDRSFASAILTQYKTADALRYLPVQEVASFQALDPIRHNEFTLGIDLNHRNNFTLVANWYVRRATDDIFPVVRTGKIHLVNMASSRDKGIELQADYNYKLGQKQLIQISNTLSYVAYRSKVISVRHSLDHAAIAGFSDVHKAIVKGQTPGVIVGNSWLRDEGGNRVIGPDGFPLVNNTPKVIGDPTPDFIMKFTYGVLYKLRWRLNVDLEWRKGGDMWNGTQAMLDYYGRSATTATQRTTVNYIFDGVQQNGSHNTVPVDFYNPSLPVTQNRWARYGEGGVAEDYIQKGDCLRLRVISISYTPRIKFLQHLSFNFYVNNIILWSPYQGADPNQLLYDQPGTGGLDFFNVPSSRSFGFNVSFQF